METPETDTITCFINQAVGRLFMGGLGGPRPPARCMPSNNLLFSKLRNVREENMRFFRKELMDFYQSFQNEEDRRAIRQFVANNFYEGMGFNEKYELTRHIYFRVRWQPNILISEIQRQYRKYVQRNSAWKSQTWRDSITLP